MPRTAHSRGLCILIADDNVEAADALGAICECAGHEVDFAYDARSALEAARRLKPDVIFIEVALPPSGGIELARQLRAAPGFGGALLVALGAVVPNSGFDRALAKPFAREAVLELLQKRA